MSVTDKVLYLIFVINKLVFQHLLQNSQGHNITQGIL